MKKPQKAHVNHERWMVSFADFMTLLFALFVVLFSISSVDQSKLEQVADSMDQAFGILPTQGTSLLHKEGQQGKPEVIKPVVPTHKAMAAKEKSLQKDLAARLKQAGLSDNDMAFRYEERGLVIQLSSSILFETGSEQLKSQAIPVIYKLASQLSALNQAIRVEGHTDNLKFKGGRSNWDLSAARATRVLQTFIKTKKIGPSRLSLAGYGEYHPIASNKTAQGRAQNRRVDIVLLNNRALVQEPPTTTTEAQATLEQELNAKMKSKR